MADKELKARLKIQAERNSIDYPDCLAITLECFNVALDIIGVRFYGNYCDMKRQFNNFLPFVNGKEKTIVGGDFNNGRIHGEEAVTYSELEIKDVYSGYDHADYNFHSIKRWFALNGLRLRTPLKGVSFPRFRSKIDHFASRGVEIINDEYLPTKLSDHAQLIGEIKF